MLTNHSVLKSENFLLQAYPVIKYETLFFLLEYFETFMKTARTS